MCDYCNGNKVKHKYYNNAIYNNLVNYFSYILEDKLFTEKELHDAVKLSSERIKMFEKVRGLYH